MAGIVFQPLFCQPPFVHNYGSHVVHRNGAPQKSQWTILYTEEKKCFCMCLAYNWIDGHKGWGLYLVNGAPQYVGVDETGTMDLFVARFEDGNANGNWHGYPMDHVRRPEDRPPEQVKRDWIRNKFVNKAKVKRIVRGQPCTL